MFRTVQRANLAEVPEVGDADVQPFPCNIARFVSHFVMGIKDYITKNRNDAAERLGFVGRVMHGSNRDN